MITRAALRRLLVAVPFATGLAAALASLGPPRSPPLVRFGAATASVDALPERFAVVVWNVHKGLDERLPADLARLAGDARLILLQEAVDRAEWTDRMGRALPGFRWTMARAFANAWVGSGTGVATGSTARPALERAVLSPDEEPVLGTPKSAVVSEFRIEGRSERLLAVNAHAINFTGFERFRRHVELLASTIEGHRGPVLLAGDFNTWSGERYAFLRARATTLGLERISPPGQTELPLDHAFVRGLVVEEAAVDASTKSSDHSPFVARLRVEGPESPSSEQN